MHITSFVAVTGMPEEVRPVQLLLGTDLQSSWWRERMLSAISIAGHSAEEILHQARGNDEGTTLNLP